jgi:hypothetical protein
MDLQETILNILTAQSAPHEEEQPANPLEWIKSIIPDTVYFKVSEFPAVICEDASPAFETNSISDNDSTTTKTQHVNLSVIIRTKNPNDEISPADYMQFKKDLISKFEQVKNVLMAELAKTPNIAGGSFGATSIDSITIESEPVMISSTPISAITI